jgi:anti-sigma factor RsiW
MSLSRDDLEARLMPYVDGELPPAEADAVSRALADHPDLAAEVDALRALSAAARLGFEPSAAHVATVRFDGLHDAVLARLAPAEASAPTFATRLAAWWRGFIAFERPLALAAVAAALVAVIGALALSGGGGEAAGGAGGGAIAGSEDPASTSPAGSASARVRRGPESEVALGARGAVRIESAEVTDGRVFVEGGETEDKPLVLWHVVDGEGHAPGAGL